MKQKFSHRLIALHATSLALPYFTTGTKSYQTFEFHFSMGFNISSEGRVSGEEFRYKNCHYRRQTQGSVCEPKRLVAHQIEHSVHFPWIGEHLAMVSHPLAAFDLFCVFDTGHKKSWNFAYDFLGVPRPAQYISKAHDCS